MKKGIETLLEKYHTQKSPGYALRITQEGTNIIRSVHGYANLEKEIAITADTNFRLASITKHFMAVAIMVLVDKKKITLDDTLSVYFDDLPKYMQSVTVFQLLTHTSGLPQYENLLDDAYEQIHDEEVYLLLRQQTEGLYAPGEKYDYNNGGFCIVRLIIERVTGKDIANFMHDEIFSKLGMNNTVINHQSITDVPHRAFGYTIEETPQRTDQDITSATIGDGGVYSSINDLEKWSQVFFSDILLSDASRTMMLTPHVLTDEGEDIYYGLGLFLENIEGTHVAFHRGSSVGFRNAILYVPERKIVVVFLSNRTTGNVIDIVRHGMGICM